MPKLLAVEVIVQTFETFATEESQALCDIKKFRESETEDVEPGVKARQYRLGWSEFDAVDSSEVRNRVLLQFLELVRNLPPGIPEKTNLIIVPK